MGMFRSKTLRKILAGSLAVLMLTSGFAALSYTDASWDTVMTAHAAGEEFSVTNECGTFHFIEQYVSNTSSSSADNSVILLSFTPLETPAETITIPSEVYYASTGKNYAVREIGRWDHLAVFSRSGAKKIIMPDTVTRLEYESLCNCEDLEELVLSDNLTYLTQGCIRGCPKLTTVHMPASLQYIEKLAFIDCTSLETVELPEGLESVGEKAFYNTKLAADTVLPDGLSLIGKDAFAGTPFWEAAIPENQTGPAYVGKVFCGYYGEPAEDNVELTLRDDTIGIAADIPGSKKITKINIPDTVENIGDYAFQNFGITELVLPASLKQMINDGHMLDCDTLKEVDMHKITGMVGSIKDNSTIEKVILPDSLEIIYSDHFQNCSALQVIVLGDHVQTIHNGAFKNCPKIWSINLPDSLTSIGSNLMECTSPISRWYMSYNGGSVVLSSKLNNTGFTVAQSAFGYENGVPVFIEKSDDDAYNTITSSPMENLHSPQFLVEDGLMLDDAATLKKYARYRLDETNKTIYIHDVSEDFEYASFPNGGEIYYRGEKYTIQLEEKLWYDYEDIGEGHAKLTSYHDKATKDVTVPSTIAGLTVTELGSELFYRRSAIERITLPATITAIEGSVFEGCTNLKSLNLDKLTNLETIGGNALYNTGLTELTVPASVASIGINAFSDNENLTKATLLCSCDLPESVFSGCTALKDVELSDTIQKLNDRAFSNSGIEQIQLPSGLTTIYSCVFEDCMQLKCLEIPSSVTAADNILGYTALPGFCNITFRDDTKMNYKNNATSDGYLYYQYEEGIATSPITGSENSRKPVVVLASGKTGAELDGVPFGECEGMVYLDENANVTDAFKESAPNCCIVTIDRTNKQVLIHENSVKRKADYPLLLDQEETAVHDTLYIDGEAYKLVHSFTAVDAKTSTCSEEGYVAHYEDEQGYCYKKEGSSYVPMGYDELYTDYDPDNHTYQGGICSGCGKLENGVCGVLGYSLNLDASIGINYYMTIDTSFRMNHPDAYVQIDLPGGKKTEKLLISEARSLDSDMVYGSHGEAVYKFTGAVSAREMNDTVTLHLYLEDGTEAVQQSYSYSVRDYAEYVLKNAEQYSSDRNLLELADAMLNYGQYAQINFNHNADKTYTAPQEYRDFLKNYTISSTPESVLAENRMSSMDADMVKGSFPDGVLCSYTNAANDTIKFVGANLSMQSVICLRLYFEISNPDGVSYTIDGTSYDDLEKKGNYWYIELADDAYNLGTTHHITVTDKDGNLAEVDYGVMAYAYSVLSRELTATRTQELKDMMKAMVIYADRAYAYYLSQNDVIQPLDPGEVVIG